MKDNRNKPVQVVYTYNASSSATSRVNTEVVTKEQPQTKVPLLKLDDHHKLIRRYSFDDNGGGYAGL